MRRGIELALAVVVATVLGLYAGGALARMGQDSQGPPEAIYLAPGDSLAKGIGATAPRTVSATWAGSRAAA